MHNFTTKLALSVPLLLSLASIAEAAPNVDLQVSMQAPSVHVYESGTYSVRVTNAGNRHASGASLVIDLPQTFTSPQVYLMGTLGAFDNRCTRSGRRLTCALGTINRNTFKTVTFNLAMPYSTAPLVINAVASSTGLAPELSPYNNQLGYTAQLALYPEVITSGNADNRVCAGTAGLSSFFECELFPSSISEFSSVLHPDNSVTVNGDPIGSWWMIGNDTLHLEYVDGGTIHVLDAKSVGGGCFEGVITFTGGWVGLHEVCVY